MKLCRIRLQNTYYNVYNNAKLLDKKDISINQLQKVFKDYCEYKQFSSVQPLFASEFLSCDTDVIAYYDNQDLAAFSIIRRYDLENLEALQFAWNYKNPNLRLGIRSLQHECAYYKSKNYKFLYLGETASYKQQFQGYEVLGPLC